MITADTDSLHLPEWRLLPVFFLPAGSFTHSERRTTQQHNNTQMLLLMISASFSVSSVAVRSLSSWDLSPRAFPSLGSFSIQIKKCCFITVPRLALIKTRGAASVPWVICVYLIHAVGHFWITSKHKYKLPLRALSVAHCRNTFSPPPSNIKARAILVF